jgi:hypothetical protein
MLLLNILMVKFIKVKYQPLNTIYLLNKCYRLNFINFPTINVFNSYSKYNS